MSLRTHSCLAVLHALQAGYASVVTASPSKVACRVAKLALRCTFVAARTCRSIGLHQFQLPKFQRPFPMPRARPNPPNSEPSVRKNCEGREADDRSLSRRIAQANIYQSGEYLQKNPL